MTTKRLLVASFLLISTGAAAEIYRCTDSGTVSYQQMPCTGTGGAVAIPTAYPDHTEARDRLAAREAAMDARLIRRLEIESVERIARDERAAREAELAAERERAAREAQYAPYFIGSPVRSRAMQRRSWGMPLR